MESLEAIFVGCWEFESVSCVCVGMIALWHCEKSGLVLFQILLRPEWNMVIVCLEKISWTCTLRHSKEDD